MFNEQVEYCRLEMCFSYDHKHQLHTEVSRINIETYEELLDNILMARVQYSAINVAFILQTMNAVDPRYVNLVN